MCSHDSGGGSQTTTDLQLIDCDVHQMWADPTEIVQHLPDHWKRRGIDVPTNPWPSPVGLM